MIKGVFEMIRYITSTVFNSNCQVITNTVNCFGVMGSGLALEFKLRYPEMFQDYKVKCQNKLVKTGKPYLYTGYSPEILIYNFPTKNHWRYPSNIAWIDAGLKEFRNTYKELGIHSIAFPKFGTRNGKLKWDSVEKLMLSILNEVDIEIVVCLDEEIKAQGLEAEMLKCIDFVSISKPALASIVQVIKSKKINRFSEIMQLKGVSKKKYEIIFNICYQKALGKISIGPYTENLFEYANQSKK
jgi:O-acetyl-ADP-ribose deacetylase (regulator of RNase III)